MSTIIRKAKSIRGLAKRIYELKELEEDQEFLKDKDIYIQKISKKYQENVKRSGSTVTIQTKISIKKYQKI